MTHYALRWRRRKTKDKTSAKKTFKCVKCRLDVDGWAQLDKRSTYNGNHCREMKCHLNNKKHLKNVGPIRHCEPPHAACFTLPFARCRYCRTPPAHRCPQQHRQQRQQRQRVTEGTAMAPWNGPKKMCWAFEEVTQCRCKGSFTPDALPYALHSTAATRGAARRAGGRRRVVPRGDAFGVKKP